MKITTEKLMNYLVDVKGYSEVELIEMIEEGEDLKSLLSDEDWAEYEEFTK